MSRKLTIFYPLRASGTTHPLIQPLWTKNNVSRFRRHTTVRKTDHFFIFTTVDSEIPNIPKIVIFDNDVHPKNLGWRSSSYTEEHKVAEYANFGTDVGRQLDCEKPKIFAQHVHTNFLAWPALSHFWQRQNSPT